MKISLPKFQWNMTISIAVIVLLALFPVIGVPPIFLLYLFVFFTYLPMANMWNLLSGYSGLISLCPAAFVGLSAYTMAILTWIGIPYYFGIIAGGIVAALFALLISVPIFRMKGIYFAIGTLVVPEALRLVFMLWRPVGGELQGGGAGYTVKGIAEVSSGQLYWFAFAIGIISIFLMRYILRSKLGRGLAAIRDNDISAASSGINVFSLKLISFIISAFVTGLAGAVFYVYQGFIEPSTGFSIRWLTFAMLATIIGGEGTESGPIFGTIVVVLLYFLLAKYGQISLLIQGVILVAIMLAAPQGIMGLIRLIRSKIGNRSFIQLVKR